MSTNEYMGWTIHQGQYPEPRWQAYGPNYDASYEGEEDGWQDNGQKVYADTLHDLKYEIDAYCDEHGWGECPMHGWHDDGGCLKC